MRHVHACFWMSVLVCNVAMTGHANNLEEIIVGLDTKPPTVLLAQIDSSMRLPPVRGMTETRARENLNKTGFNKVTSYVSSEKVKCPSDDYRSNSYVPGIVCATNPAFGGGSISTDTEIALLVQGERKDDEQYGFPPKVIGMSRADAVKTLAERKWNTELLRYAFVDECAPGNVCDLRMSTSTRHQRPDGSWDNTGWPDAPDRLRDPFTLVIGSRYPGAKPTDQIEMIDLTGDLFDEILEKLDRLGVRGDIQLDSDHYSCSGTEIKAGRVCDQTPRKGAPTTKRASVRVVVSKGLAPLPTRSADDSPFPATGEPATKNRDAQPTEKK
jgi:beta-lactam-binding protein with PASTA domain